MRLQRPISSTWIAEHLGLKHSGPVQTLAAVAALAHSSHGTLTFANNREIELPHGPCIITYSEHMSDDAPRIFSSAPRLDFARALTLLEERIGFDRSTQSSTIHSSVKLGTNVVIHEGVAIGAGTKVHPNAVIGPNVTIGQDCVIRAGAVIGEEGFGFARDENDIPVRIPQIGGVKIGNHVQIGTLSTVQGGTLQPTVIEDSVKIDDHCHIGHNCHVKTKAIVTAGTILCGRVVLGEACWIAPNTSIHQGIEIGDKALVGMSANVLKDVAANTTVAGNPAKVLRQT